MSSRSQIQQIRPAKPAGDGQNYELGVGNSGADKKKSDQAGTDHA